MALDLRGIDTFPHTALLAANATTVVEIQLGHKATKLSLGSETDSFRVYCIPGIVDGGTPGGSDGYQFCAKDNLLEYKLSKGAMRRTSVFVKFDSSGSGNINVNLEA